MDENETGELRAALARDCGLSPAAGAPADRHSLLDELTRRVDYLMRHDADKLMFYLYTLDVAEDDIARAFTLESGEEPARAVARAILDREAARLRTRKRYEEGGHPGPPQLG